MNNVKRTLNEIVEKAAKFFWDIGYFPKPEIELYQGICRPYSCAFNLAAHDDDLLHLIKNSYLNALDAILEKFGTEARNKGKLKLMTNVQGDYDVFEISDNGIGMDEEAMSRFHEDGFTTKRDKIDLCGGEGRGLHGFLRVIEGYHGRYEVDSKPNGGTTFRLFLLPA